MTSEEIIKALNEIRNELNKIQETINNMSLVEPVNINNISDSSKYNLSQSAKLLKIDRKTLRCHADNGLVKCSFSKANKRRMFTGLELKRYYKSV